MKDEIDAKLECERKKTIGKIVFTLLVILGIAFIAGLELSKPEPRVLFDGDEGLKAHDGVTYSQLGINETLIAEREAERNREMQIWLAPNQTRNYTVTVPDDTNVTVWKGDKVVCYIPAQPVFTVRSITANRINIVPAN